MDDGRERSIYRGIVVSSLVLIIIPIIPFLLIYFAILKYDTTMSDEMRLYSAMMFGFGTGSLFHISCILLGFLRDDFKILLKRIRNFFSNLFVSPKVAIICYKSELKEGGVVFWIHLLIILIVFALFLIGFNECMQYYLNF